MNADFQKGLLSVIVPVYNAEANVKDCMVSLCAQEYGNVEILAVNDGSRDRSYEILLELAQQDPRIKVFTQENQGVSAARNAGLAHAAGEFVTFVDADDWVDPNTYSSIIRRMDEQEANVAVYAFSRDYKNTQEPDPLPYDNSTVLDEAQIRGDLIPRMVASNRHSPSVSGSVCRSVFRAGAIEDILFDEKVHIQEDLIFCIESYAKAKKILIVNDVHYHYVKHEVTTTERFRRDYYNESLRFESRIIEALLKIGLFDQVRDRYWAKRIGMYSLCVSNLFRKDAPAEYQDELSRIVKAFRKDPYIKGRFHPEYLNKKKAFVYSLLSSGSVWLVSQVYSRKERSRQSKLSV